MFKSITIFLLLSFACMVWSNNLKLGQATPLSRTIFEKIRHGTSKKGWRAARYITVHAPENELISAVYVTDLSNTSDAVSFVKSGGIGRRDITLGLKSSKDQLRSKFQVKVFAEKQDERGFLASNKDRVIGIELREAPGRVRQKSD